MLSARPRRVAAAAACVAAAAVAASSHAAERPRALVYDNAYAMYSVRPDGTRWQRLNECTLGPMATNGRQIVGAFYGTSSPALVLMPADKEVVNDCDNGPRDRSVRHYRLTPRGTVPSYWTTLAWSPDGRRILGVGSFGTGYAQRSRIAVFNPNGARYHLLGPSLDGSGSYVTDAAWSPRGDQIVFGRAFESGDCPEFAETKTVAIGCDRSELAVMNADGSEARSLYRPPQIESSERDDLPEGSQLRALPSPRFSPFGWHGDRIFLTVTEADADPDVRIAVIDQDGTGFRYLTPAGSNAVRPALSPDGRQIAFIWYPGPGCTRKNGSTYCGVSTALYVMSSSGGRARKLVVRQPLTSVTCERGSLPGRKTCTVDNIGFGQVTW
jgi:dipeptidyl aminopeptidase/acylaminoacyl peptidase